MSGVGKELVIVESPAKSKTISRFLGDGYQVLSSYGHIRDLKTKGMGVDIERNFAPQYEISEDKKKVVSELKAVAKKADKVWLASDEDREGEAIAWHLAEVLGLDPKDKNRIAFHEITPKAIEEALANPRTVDKQMVDAQQARRVLDRIVGFELSPVLWRKIRPNLSAGRVQSVALRIIVDREREIQAFEAESSFRLRATLLTDKGEVIEAELNRRLQNADEVRALLEGLKGASYQVAAVEVKPAKKRPAPPFTTSTLQQEAARRLGFPVGVTMRVAQSLYEAGHITYMRTDSLNLSDFAIATTCKEVEQSFGEQYVRSRNFTTKSKGAQEAHEAIRPTHIERESVGSNKQERSLYEMIRQRTLATQMADAEVERTTLTIESGSGETFQAKGEVITFDGFLKVYLEGTDDEAEGNRAEEGKILPKVKKGSTLIAEEVIGTERFTQRPPRYTEASLVKRMEELGIGRPSTYAPTIQTIQKREYVERRSIDGEERSYQQLKLKGNRITSSTKKERFGADKNKLFPTDMGLVVTDFLVDSFPNVMDYNFTAEVEQYFDEVAEGKMEWTDLLARFYNLFHPNVEKAMEERTELKVGERKLGDDPKSGEPIFAKIGRYGPMVQMGEVTEKGSKPKFASIPKELSLETITLEQALKLFTLPRALGTFQGEEVEANIGRFGSYVRFGKLFASIPKELSPYSITLEEATPLMERKLEQERNKHIATFGEGEDTVQVLNGRYGSYISYQKKNYKIPKDEVAQELTEARAREIIAEGGTKGKDSKRSTTKKSRAKKSSKSTRAKK